MMKKTTALLLFFLSVLFLQSASAADRILYEKNSLYQYIVVSEDVMEGKRYLHNNEKHIRQGGMDIRNPNKLVFEYYRTSMISLAFLDDEPKEILVVGLGAGAVPKYLNRYYPDATIDVVEIDPEVLTVAQKYFQFKENDKMKVHINDGRMFIKRTKKKYDLIFLDAYRHGTIPFHLTTREFLAETKRILKPGGVVTSNILSESANQFHDSMIVTYQDAFEHLYIFSGKQSENHVFVATDQKKVKRQKEALEKSRRITTEKRLDVNLPTIAEDYTYGSILRDIKADMLTDDFAPVDILRHKRSRS
ncbi:MAG: fused MFS/spermidine synthase [Nitrospirae bacterium]|nr:fused MFS/spermidine synthase [Nitrospirota bacterium]MCL5977776.1 fused MFS/spermidine synthase [Nitrospirota bacterium]